MTRPIGVFKVRNEYVDAMPRGFYADTPKAVFAAVALSLAGRVSGIETLDATAEIIREWQALYENGIVPQKPPTLAREALLR